MNFDVTEILTLIVKLLVAVTTVFLIPYLKKKYGETKLNEVMKYVDIFVAAAEQLYDASDCAKKKQYVLDQLKAAGFNIDSVTLDAEIESAVNKLHNELVTKKTGLPITAELEYIPARSSDNSAG